MKTVGFCSLCSKSNCSKRIHVTCAQRNKCTIEVIKEEDKSIDFRAYCSKHKPEKSKRRVSSKFIRNVVAKKGTKALKSKYARSANLNANWILSKQENAPLNNEKQPSDQSTSSPSNDAIEDQKLRSQNIEKVKEKIVAKNKSNEKKSKPVDTSKPSTSNAVSKILKSIENKIYNAQHELSAIEIAPVDTSTPKSSNVATMKEKQCETVEGKFFVINHIIACDTGIKLYFNQHNFFIQSMQSGETSASESMLWDSCGGSLDVSLGFVSIEHSCYKDEQIAKVNIKNKNFIFVHTLFIEDVENFYILF